MHSVCVVVELHVTVKCIKILSVTQQCFHCKLMSPITVQIVRTSFRNKLYSPTNLHSFHTLHLSDAFKYKNVRLLMAFFRRTIWLNRL
jgi:hypothetical protein